MLNTQKFDIMNLSETWLKDNPHLRDYGKIDSYELNLEIGSILQVTVLVYISDQTSNTNLEMIL